MKTFNKLQHINSALNLAKHDLLFGFIRGHDYIDDGEISRIESLVGKKDPKIIRAFENEFAQLIGEGEAVAYASGRMGFYDLLRHLSVTSGDEIIVPGATCAVMINAILRTGATPVFADIDPYTFGSDPISIEKNISPATRVIVAQHSFGIPCRIAPIADMARNNDIFLLEDCALSVDSRYENRAVGNFGDAALFSTDHSKPLNTIIGGLIYTRNPYLAIELRKSGESYEELPAGKQKALWQCLLQERKYCNPEEYARVGINKLINLFKQSIFKVPSPFLTEDSGTNLTSSYPYPARLPAFLAAVGLKELIRWKQSKLERKTILGELLNLLKKKTVSKFLSEVYFDDSFEITPLRFVWSEDGSTSRRSLESCIYTQDTWFMEPVISTTVPLSRLGYQKGTCRNSEKLGHGMVNIPCNFQVQYSRNLLKLIEAGIR